MISITQTPPFTRVIILLILFNVMTDFASANLSEPEPVTYPARAGNQTAAEKLPR